EADPHRLAQRKKEISYGYNTLGYDKYLVAIPKDKRKRSDPATPDVTIKYSKRQFDGIVRAWRRRLHEWDDPKD
ncbi:histone RNA hairpin-binding protein, partial [Pelagophyceae sp. CCMP2097]